MVISPTLAVRRAISSSRPSRSRSFSAVAAPARARPRHSVRRARVTFSSRATVSSGSPRSTRVTAAILRWAENRWGAPAPPPAYVPALRSFFRPPVAVTLPQSAVSSNRAAPHSSNHAAPQGASEEALEAD